MIFWLPTILKNRSGLSDAQVGLFGAVPYVVALFAMLFNGWHSDRNRERRWHAAAPLLMAATGLVCLISLPSSNVMLVLLLSVICMAMAFLPVFWAIPTEILSGSKAAVAVGTINALASLAGFAGPYAFGYLQNRNRLFRRWIRGVDILCTCGRDSHATDTSRTVAQSQTCHIELTTAGQIQFRFDSLDNLLRRSSQFDR